MAHPFLSSKPLALPQGLALARMLTGLLLMYHGWEVFDSKTMETYLNWEVFQHSAGPFMAYLGKSLELISGILLLLGLFTRMAAIIIIGTFLYITFGVGKGRFWYQDQHPFLFAIIGWIFLFAGPGAWSLDQLIFASSEKETR